MKASEGRGGGNAGRLRGIRAVLHSAAVLDRHLHQASALAAFLHAEVSVSPGSSPHPPPGSDRPAVPSPRALVRRDSSERSASPSELLTQAAAPLRRVCCPGGNKSHT